KPTISGRTSDPSSNATSPTLVPALHKTGGAALPPGRRGSTPPPPNIPSPPAGRRHTPPSRAGARPPPRRPPPPPPPPPPLSLTPPLQPYLLRIKTAVPAPLYLVCGTR